ncbi:hypothetical protein K7H20_15075 [Salipiger manganoxidans]|uniref:hypothetical protein n=1 Tax=Salipiger marinus TaxID=555512 RepID=UPI001E2B59C2|nr:hypothetical protein [Salipiger manganoxidans]MCD1619382.1 hypothetical protein [Salipiger manganoxidans]
MTRHAADFIRDLGLHKLHYTRGGDTLVVTFDNAGIPYKEPYDRKPWGHKFFVGEGCSVLGVIPKSALWYRDDALFDVLDSLRDEGFFRAFAKVIFTGSSMGGYAAAAFSSLAEGAVVISYNPISTLARELAPWETGHKNGKLYNWSGRYHDSAAEIATARQVYILYDPMNRMDRLHAQRFSGPNVMHLATPFSGHGIPGVLLEMDSLKQVMREGVAETLTTVGFARMMRHRRSTSKYWKCLIEALIRSNRMAAGAHYCRRMLETETNPYFRYRLALCLAGDGQPGAALDILESIERERKALRKKRAKRSIQAQKLAPA